MSSAHIFESELDQLGAWTAAWPARETGGALFGYWTHSGAPVVVLTTGPGPGARHEEAAFYQEAAFLESSQREVWEAYGLQHIGEWHSHHRLGLAEPSAGDERTVWRGMASRGWSRFVLGIANLGERSTDVTVGFYLFDAESDTLTPCEVRVMQGENPFRLHAPGFGEHEDVPAPERMARARPRHLKVEMEDEEQLRPVAESVAWCASEEGQARLGKEVAGLRVLEEVFGCTTRVHLEGQEVLVTVTRDDFGEVGVVMGEGYPATPARFDLPGGALDDEAGAERLVAERLAVWLQASEEGARDTEA